MANIPVMMTIAETAEKTGLAQHYIRQLCLQNKIVYVTAGKKYLINFDRFIAYLNTGEQATDTECQIGKIRRLD